MSIIAQGGAVKWNEIALPAGRTQKAAMHTYQAMKKEAEKTPMAAQGESGSAAPSPEKARNQATPRKPKGQPTENEASSTVPSPVTPKKVPATRKPKAAANSTTSTPSRKRKNTDDDEVPDKKAKIPGDDESFAVRFVAKAAGDIVDVGDDDDEYDPAAAFEGM